jgi:DNA-binding transcriptional ArsR family regulator
MADLAFASREPRHRGRRPSRPTTDRVLAVPNRRRVHQAVAADPGAGFLELVRACGLGAGTVRHHLTVLAKHGLVAERRHGARTAFFEARACGDAWRGVVALRDPSLRLLHAAVAAAPGGSQSAFVQAMARHGWTRTTTQHRLARLERHGLLRSGRGLRAKLYWASPPDPDLALLPPSPGQPLAYGAQEQPLREESA